MEQSQNSPNPNSNPNYELLTPNSSLPTNAPCEENAAAYRLFKPEPIEDPIAPEQFAELKRSLVNALSMPKPKATEQPTPTTDPLEELNIWIKDPILRPEAMKRIMQSERYTVEFDEEGNPISVVEVKQ